MLSVHVVPRRKAWLFYFPLLQERGRVRWLPLLKERVGVRETKSLPEGKLLS
jgi:hypothetical protein